MNIQIKWTNMKPSPAVATYALQKFRSLEKLSIASIETMENKMGDAVQAWVEIAKTNKHHQKGNVYYVECQIRLPRKSIRATSTRQDPHIAVDEVRNELHQLLKRYKEKKSSGIQARIRKMKDEGEK